jgi:hypothetical protein
MICGVCSSAQLGTRIDVLVMYWYNTEYPLSSLLLSFIAYSLIPVLYLLSSIPYPPQLSYRVTAHSAAVADVDAARRILLQVRKNLLNTSKQHIKYSLNNLLNTLTTPDVSLSRLNYG